MTAYSFLDQPSLLKFLFYPRRDHTPPGPNAYDIMTTIEENVQICSRFYLHEKDAPWILYFHGNGEVVSDYDGIAPLYHEQGVNLVVADYRGYGASSGSPTFSSLVEDAHPLFRSVREELAGNDMKGDIWIMGRSMGSIPALELAANYQEELNGLIIESGFACPVRLIKHLGLPVEIEGIDKIEEESDRKVRSITLPVLLLHGEEDRLVPLEEAEDLEQRLNSKNLELVSIPRAGHNDIMFVGRRDYFEQFGKFISNTKSG